MPVHSRVVFIAALVAGGTSACVAPTVTTTLLGAERTYPSTPDTTSIPLYTVTKPQCPYDEIALVSVEGGSSPSAATNIAALRNKARTLGGQAIIGYEQHSYVSARGTAIRFRSTDCMN